MGTQQKQTSLRRLQDVLKRSWRLTTKPAVLKTSGRGSLICNVLKTSDLRCLEDLGFTTSWRRLICDVLKTSDLRRLEDVWFTTSWRRRIYVFSKTSDLWCLEDVCLTTFWRRPIYDVLKMSVERRLCSNVVATSTQRRNKWFFLILYCLKYSKSYEKTPVSECRFERTAGHRLIKKTPTQMFSCESCKIFKRTYFEEPLTANGCLLICFMKINHLPQRDQKR